MAAIDKTYVSTLEEWKEIQKWAKKTTFTCPSGVKMPVWWWCYGEDMTDEEVQEWLKEAGEVPVMNTSEALDYFLLKECPIKRIQDRLREVYPEDWISAVLSGTSTFDTFRRPTPGKHYRFVWRPRCQYSPSYIGLSGKVVGGRYNVSVDIPGDPYAGYNEDYGRWVFSGELGYWTVSGGVTIRVRSLKALIRVILSWGLPVGTRISFGAGWDDTRGEIILKK